LNIEIRQLPENIGKAVWNGTDENGKPVSSGIYLYQLKIDEKVVAGEKMILLK
jgi:hypothetical protein